MIEKKIADFLARVVADALPRIVVYWCGIRIADETGRSDTISIVDACRDFDRKKGIRR